MPTKLKNGTEIPTLLEHAGPRPTESDKRFQRYRNGNLTPQGRADLDKALTAYAVKEGEYGKLYGPLIQNEGEQGSIDVDKQKAATDYRKSTLGQVMSVANPGALFGGGAIGGYGGKKFGDLMAGERPLVASKSVRGAMMLPYLLASGVSAGKGLDLKYIDAKDPDKTPYEKDVAETLGNLGIGLGGASAVSGAVNSLKDIGRLGAFGEPRNALAPAEKPMNTLDLKAETVPPQNALAGPKPEAVPQIEAAPETPKPEVPVDPRAKIAKDAAKVLGAEGDLSHGDAVTFLKGRLKSGDLSAPEKEGLRKALQLSSPSHTFSNAIKKLGPAAVLLGVLGLSGDADAAPSKAPDDKGGEYKDLENKTDQVLGKGLRSFTDSASYMMPYVGEARLTHDIGNALISSYNPTDNDLADAEYWRQGTEEMRRRREEGDRHEQLFAKTPQTPTEQMDLPRPGIGVPGNALASNAPNAPFNRALQEFIAHFAGQSGQR